MVDRGTFKAAEKVLQYLKENDMLMTRGAILVGNKTDLQRHREVSRQGECICCLWMGNWNLRLVCFFISGSQAGQGDCM